MPVFVFVSQVANESTPLVISRVVLQEYATSLPKLEAEQHVKVAQVAIEKIQPRVVAFEDQISIIRENLSAVFEEHEQWNDAAKILLGIPLESGQRCVLLGDPTFIAEALSKAAFTVLRSLLVRQRPT